MTFLTLNSGDNSQISKVAAKVKIILWIFTNKKDFSVLSWAFVFVAESSTIVTQKSQGAMESLLHACRYVILV